MRLTSCAVVTKSGNMNFLEPSGPLQACNETALPFYSKVMGEVQVSIILWPLIYDSCHMVCGYQHSEEHKSSIFAPTMGTSVPYKHILLLNVLPSNITLYYLYQQWCMFQVFLQTILRHKNNYLKPKSAWKLNIINLHAHKFYNLVFNSELQNQLKEALTELSSAQLIIKLIQLLFLIHIYKFCIVFSHKK